MPMPTPKIDPRSYDEVVQQTSALVQYYTGWQPSKIGADAGSALIRIFGRMVEQIIERLNQAPEKNFLAFLDLIGVQILPPKPAKAPLTFQLVATSPVDALVPAGTQVAALPREGEDEETIFETDSDLVVTRAQLAALFVRQPSADQYADNTPTPANAGNSAFSTFVGTKLIEHSLYLAKDEIFTAPGPKTVTLRIGSSNPNGLAALPIVWEYWDGTNWSNLSASATVQAGQWQVTMTNLPIPALTTINELTAAWIRARLNTALPPGAAAPPDMQRITTEVTVTRSGLTSAHGFANSVPLDLSKDFYPFGEQPKLNDAFYLAIPEAAAKPNATITVNITLSNPPPVPPIASADLAITWETWDGAKWAPLSVPAAAVPVAKFTASGSVALTLPATVVSRVVNSETGYWLRARITQGNYGTPVTPQVTTTRDDKGDTSVNVAMTGGYGPPSLASLTLDYIYTWSGDFTACYTYNDFLYTDQTAAAAKGTPFSPFIATTETRPTLYLGFDQPFDNRPMALYFQVDPPRPGEIADAVRAPVANASPPRVVWEYSGATGWRSLGAVDETKAFAESGLIRFIGPADFTARTEFGQKCYWLRARWQDGTFLIQPRLRRVLTNTMWATQATTIHNEILGSSTGEANQSFYTAQTPVLLGQHLEVQESDMPSAEDQALLEALEGQDAITVTLDETGQPEEIWVRWHAVPDFYGSGPRDRHYVIDYLTGEVRFGNEQHGLAPPAGRNNVRMAQYRTSSGAQGNRPVESITQLKTTVPYVESVINLEAAEGGADQEDLERVKERGPQSLRHRGRATTVQDIEDLASEAAPEVARARALPPAFDPNTLEWLPVFHLPLTQAGEISVTAKWEGGQTLTLIINGPGSGLPYAQATGKSDQTVKCTVAADRFVLGDLWRVTIVNRDASAARSGRVEITYPVGSLDVPLDNIPANTAYTPKSPIRQGGQIELVIVPQDLAPRPTPSLALLARVKEYILARCSPTVTFQVTEPDWVEVTVTAQVTPASFAAAEALQANVVIALERFLHPLTGGFNGSGWPFGRRPHVSDLYAAIESVVGVGYVRSLSVVNRPSLADIDPPQPGETAEDAVTLPRLPKERRDRFLIFSGRHQITVAASEDQA